MGTLTPGTYLTTDRWDRMHPAEKKLRRDMMADPRRYGIRTVPPAPPTAMDRIDALMARRREAREYADGMRIRQLQLEAEVAANRPKPIPMWGWLNG